MKKLLLLLCGCLSAFAVGTVTQSVSPIGPAPATGPDLRTYVLQVTWVGDAANGSVPSTVLNSIVQNTAMQGMRISSVEIQPGTPNPSALYAITLTDATGADLLAGVGANLSATTASFSSSVVSPPLLGVPTFNLSGNSVNSAQGKITIYFVPLSLMASARGLPATLGANNTLTGQNAITTYQINSVQGLLDGNKYPLTIAGLQNLLTAQCPGPVSGYVLLTGQTITGTGTLTIPSNCHISGMGKDMTILLEPANENLSTFVTAANGATNITIDNLTIDCNQANNTGPGQTLGCVVFPNAPTHIRIHDVSIRNFFGVTGTTTPCLFFGGISNDINIYDNFIFNCGGSGHSSDGAYSGGGEVRIENNTFDTISDTGAVCEAFTDCLINGNTFINANNAIAASGLVTGVASAGVVITGNTVLNGNSTAGAAIRVLNVAPGTMRASTVLGNTVRDTTSGACILVQKVYDLTLTDNTCENISPASTNQPIGFLIQDSSVLRIGNNSSVRAGAAGLQLQGVSNATVVGGTFWMNSQQSPGINPGVFILGGTLTINTTIAAGVGSTGQQTVTPGAMTNITVGVPLLIGPGPNCSSASTECVVPTAISSTTFTAVFNQTHGAAVTVAEAPSNSITITGVQSYGFTQSVGMNLSAGDNILLTGNDFRFNLTNPGFANSATGNIRQCGNLTNSNNNAAEICNFASLTSPTITGTPTSTTITPAGAGASDLGTAALPWGNLWLGTAATNNFKVQPAATAGPRIITITDPVSPTTVGLPLTIASGTATMTTAAINTLTCGTTVTVAATGVATTDSIFWNDNAAPAAATNGVLPIKAWPTAGNVNFFYCNPTAGSVTPAAATLNWRVVR